MDNKKQSDEHHKPTEENVVKDLRKSLEDAIDQTKHILVDLEQTVETTIKDQSISEETKKIVDSISDEIKNAFRAFEKGEIQYRQFPPIVWEIPNLKKNCFKQDNYETLKELARNCYFFHSSYIMEYGFDDTKWFAVQTEFKDSKDLLNEDNPFFVHLDEDIFKVKGFMSAKRRCFFICFKF